MWPWTIWIESKNPMREQKRAQRTNQWDCSKNKRRMRKRKIINICVSFFIYHLINVDTIFGLAVDFQQNEIICLNQPEVKLEDRHMKNQNNFKRVRYSSNANPNTKHYWMRSEWLRSFKRTQRTHIFRNNQFQFILNYIKIYINIFSLHMYYYTFT